MFWVSCLPSEWETIVRILWMLFKYSLIRSPVLELVLVWCSNRELRAFAWWSWRFLLDFFHFIWLVVNSLRGTMFHIMRINNLMLFLYIKCLSLCLVMWACKSWCLVMLIIAFLITCTNLCWITIMYIGLSNLSSSRSSHECPVMGYIVGVIPIYFLCWFSFKFNPSGDLGCIIIMFMLKSKNEWRLIMIVFHSWRGGFDWVVKVWN